MMELKITVTAPDISEAIKDLASAIRNGMTIGATTTNTTSVIADTTAEVAIPNPTNPNSAPQTATVADTQTNVSYRSKTPAPIVAVNEPAIAPANGQAIPTAAPQYTLEMIAKAGTALIDAGKMNELTALLARYGVEALTTLDPAHYGTFANELRALGASI